MAGAGQYTVTTDCGGGNDYDGRLGLRISSIFVIGAGSLLGALLPIAAARTKRMHIPPLAFFIAKYFGSGVIIATAFIHLLSPASANLTSPCLTGPITQYDWAHGIALMTIFLMFFIEIMAARFDVFGGNGHDHDLEASDPSTTFVSQIEKPAEAITQMQMASPNSLPIAEGSSQNSDANLIVPTSYLPQPEVQSKSTSETTSISGHGEGLSKPISHKSNVIPGRTDDWSYPPGGEDHLGHQRDHTASDDHYAAQMTGLFILEFGVLFHSVFIGLTLAVAGSDFTVLYIVLVFHQTFEGLGLGSRLATAEWPKKKSWMPWVLGGAYGVSTPIAIAIGLGIRATFTPGSQRTMIVNGIFDAISAGILIYTGLVELMAHEFMFNPEMRKSSIKMMIFAYLCMCLGAGLMALLGKWA